MYKIFGVGILAAIVLYMAVSIGRLTEKLDSVENGIKTYSNRLDDYMGHQNNLIKEMENDKVELRILRDNVESGIVRLSILTERNSNDTASGLNLIEEATQLNRQARQAYFNLRESIIENQYQLEGWRVYYCAAIAPHNNTTKLCEDIK